MKKREYSDGIINFRDEQFICNACVSERYLKGIIIKWGKTGTCSYCKKKGKVRTLGFLVDKIETAFEQFYERTPEEHDEFHNPHDAWYREGNDVIDVISDIAGIDEKIAKDVLDILQDKYFDWENHTMGIENEFDKGSQYELKFPHHGDLQEKWNEFKTLVGKRDLVSRNEAEAILTDIFSVLDELLRYDKKTVVVAAGPKTEINVLHRARVFYDEDKLMDALAIPDAELGTPPAHVVKAGRMNWDGSPVFYGAEDVNTAVSEVRPPVGSYVAVASFEIIRDLRILDLEKLNEAFIDGSIFSHDELKKRQKAWFLRRFSDLICIPVMPDKENKDYLPSQAVADFVCNKLGLDGIRYRSVQTSGPHAMNIVLFEKASEVDRLDTPKDTKIEKYKAHSDEEYDSPYCVHEIRPKGSLDKITTKGATTATLRVLVDKIVVNKIEAVSYVSKTTKVNRALYRNCEETTEDREDKFDFFTSSL
ncbi:RES family NAD+ phosphorylase [Chitinophaga sp.]|uniref:RES family NAD+ phosphorylase n=1 Tax=Chitinophaga sp. TaxID=1869181 RepID=UPI0031D2F524